MSSPYFSTIPPLISYFEHGYFALLKLMRAWRLIKLSIGWDLDESLSNPRIKLLSIASLSSPLEVYCNMGLNTQSYKGLIGTLYACYPVLRFQRGSPPIKRSPSFCVDYRGGEPWLCGFLPRMHMIFCLWTGCHLRCLQNLSSNESRVFDITIGNKEWASSRDVFNAANNVLYVPVELSLFNSTDSLAIINVSLVQSPGSTLGPIVNAAELYAVTAPPPPSTLASDGKRYWTCP